MLVQFVKLFPARQKEVRPPACGAHRKHVVKLRQLWCFKLNASNAEPGNDPAPGMAANRCLYLDSIQIPILISHDKNIVTTVNFWNSHVVAAKKKLRHDSELSGSTD